MHPGWILGMTTVTKALGLAVGEDAGTGCHRFHRQAWLLDRQMAACLHPCLQAFMPKHLSWRDCIGVAVAMGPGSFTGTRLGVTVARTLGQTLGIPVYGFSALAALAWGHQGRVGVYVDAQRQEWFGGIYTQQGSRITVVVPEQLWSHQQWQEQLEQNQVRTVLCLDDAVAADVLALHLVEMAAIDASLGVRWADSWSKVVPIYSRRPPIGQG